MYSYAPEQSDLFLHFKTFSQSQWSTSKGTCQDDILSEKVTLLHVMLSEDECETSEERFTILPEEGAFLHGIFYHFAAYGQLVRSSELLFEKGFRKLVSSLDLKSKDFHSDDNFAKNIFYDAVGSDVESGASFQTFLAALGHVAGCEYPDQSFSKAMRALLEGHVFPLASTIKSRQKSAKRPTPELRTPRVRSPGSWGLEIREFMRLEPGGTTGPPKSMQI